MNYRHLYHAGNFADVFKHLVVLLILEYLQRKDSGFCVIDTHAGCGLYDLGSDEASRTHEYLGGIGKIWMATDLPEPIERYRQLVLSLDDPLEAPQGLRWYPGSPWIARRLLRPQDRLIACELHPVDAQFCKTLFANDGQVSVHHMDGYAALKAYLPPRERRGFVLIDPPYEDRDEAERLVEALGIAQRRFPTGVYALWYPVKDRAAVWRFHERLAGLGFAKILVAELMIAPEDTAFRLNGCGLAIVNPPWQLDQQLQSILPGLHGLLAPGAGGTRLGWLDPDETSFRA